MHRVTREANIIGKPDPCFTKLGLRGNETPLGRPFSRKNKSITIWEGKGGDNVRRKCLCKERREGSNP